MPILIANNNAKVLCQGDILKGITLFRTPVEWGGEAEPTPRDKRYAMVVSRPCKCVNSGFIIVAEVERFTAGVPSTIESFSDAKAFLTDLRDGGEAPDQFYLGQIPNEPAGRYVARLNALYTLDVPSNEASKNELVNRFRIAHLTEEFVHDLHARIFNAFARLGFDDYKWYSNEDLKWLVEYGQSEIFSAQAALSLKTIEKTGHDASGGYKSAQHKDGLEKEIKKESEKVQALREKLAPFEAEVSRRQNAGIWPTAPALAAPIAALALPRPGS